MKCNDLSLRARTSVSQNLPIDLEEKISSFTSFVCDIREESDFNEHCIINMDEIPLYFDIVPGKCVDKKGSDTSAATWRIV